MIIINIDNLILKNIYSFSNLREDNTMTRFTTLNNDYIIEMEREDNKVYRFENSFNYLCKFHIKNNLDIPVLDILLNEKDIYVLLDSIYSYIEFNMIEISIPVSNYLFNFERINNIINLSIVECNNFYKTNITRVKIDFNDDKLSQFIDLLYFTFLIDIDDGYILENNPNFMV